MASQIDIISAVTKCLEKSGFLTLNTRQLNTVIEAANLILESLNEKHRPAAGSTGLSEWLRSDETGLSSRYMARVFSPASVPGERGEHGGINYPHDPDDFNRCVGLLNAVPAFREKIHLLENGHGPVWAALVPIWSELESLLEKEKPKGVAKKLYARMRSVIEPAEKASN